jgi:hypothetical protein
MLSWRIGALRYSSSRGFFLRPPRCWEDEEEIWMLGICELEARRLFDTAVSYVGGEAGSHWDDSAAGVRYSLTGEEPADRLL